ncbi:MAG: lysophospholipid acyltransferase family protein [Bacteroidota bacterium]
MSLYRTLRGALGPLFQGIFRLKAPLVPVSGGAVVVANHASNLDPLALSLAVEPPLAFMAKAEMFKVPLLAPLIRSLGAFPVHRGGGGRPTIEAAIQQAKEGRLVAMFPEGTRTKDGNLQPLKAGVAIIALEAGVPILPVAIHGTYRILPRGRFFPRFGRIRLSVGTPIDAMLFQDHPDKVEALTKEVRGALEKLLEEA